jgi:hypothetical protein
VFAVEEQEIIPLCQVPWKKDMSVFGGISISSSGTYVAPHKDGAGFFDVDGSCIRSFAVSPTDFDGPCVSICASGRWVASTAEGGVLLWNTKTDKSKIVDAEFSQVLKLTVTNAGTAYVGGCGKQSWGLYRVKNGSPPVRISEDHQATVSPNEKFLVEVGSRNVVARALSLEPKKQRVLKREKFLLLPRIRGGEARFINNDRVVVQTDTYHLAGINISKMKS